MTYDADGNVLTSQVFNADNTLAQSVTNVWENGNLIKTTDGYGNYTDMTYDAEGERLWSKTYGPTSAVPVAEDADNYDLADNPSKATDGDGNYTVETFDALGHVLTRKTYSPDDEQNTSSAETYRENGNGSETYHQ